MSALEMTDAEISRRLALAIGWEEKLITYESFFSAPMIHVGYYRKSFDYRDPSVIWPIAERFNCFPMRIEGGWGAWSCVCFWTADTAAKAVALAVIKAKEQK